MPDHAHLILTPSGEDGLRAALARTHRRYAGHIHGVPRRAQPGSRRLVERARDWHWSSVHANLGLTADDGLTATAPVSERFPDLAERIAAGEDEAVSARLRRAEPIGRPVGGAAFIAGLERPTGRSLAPARRGPKPKAPGELSALSP
jgi:putative transposase